MKRNCLRKPSKCDSEISEAVHVFIRTASNNPKNVGKAKCLYALVPQENQTVQCFLIVHDSLDYFLCRIVTCDEMWILYDNGKRSSQRFDHGECSKYFPKLKLYEQNIVVTVWKSTISVVLYSFLEANKIVRADDEIHALFHKGSLHLQIDVAQNCFPDNAKPHVATITLDKFTGLRLET